MKIPSLRYGGHFQVQTDITQRFKTLITIKTNKASINHTLSEVTLLLQELWQIVDSSYLPLLHPM
jgi:hypothetical protein